MNIYGLDLKHLKKLVCTLWKYLWSVLENKMAATDHYGIFHSLFAIILVFTKAFPKFHGSFSYFHLQ